MNILLPVWKVVHKNNASNGYFTPYVKLRHAVERFLLLGTVFFTSCLKAFLK